ncbi:uncharacterized protein LOC132943800 [Metopolophium dirhodum]|uniref:uncharacterized protein LOC132943800 n=1 Tax=Metopolophium dirhodum TaxID=44670 RepID=UPI00298FBBB7|nr:uncharacterized protein LOC132943800 [Metopolophium dirhodum]
MFMVCTFVQAPLQQGKYIQFAPHIIVSDIPTRPSFLRETMTDLPTVLPTQNDHSSTVRHTAIDCPAGPPTQNNCSSTVRDNAIHTFSCYVVCNECMEDVNIIENLGLHDMQGFAVLEIPKTIMYNYHCNVIQAHYGNTIELIYIDTDSLVYYIHLENNSNLLDQMDSSDLPQDHPCYIAKRKKIQGLFSDETNGEVMTHFCAFYAKSYTYKINGKEKIRAKGHVVKN